jgi:hypothetical protein
MNTRQQLLERHFNSFIEDEIPSLIRQGYDARYYKAMVSANGGSHRAVTQILLHTPGHTQYGFQRLYFMNRLDASVEYAASLPWFQELFTDGELYEARTRLITHEFDLDGAIVSAAANPPAWLLDLERDEEPDELQALAH